MKPVFFALGHNIINLCTVHRIEISPQKDYIKIWCVSEHQAHTKYQASPAQIDSLLRVLDKLQ